MPIRLVGLSRGSKRRVHHGNQTSGSESSKARKYFLLARALPAHLGRNIGSRHLAFSLKQSDHRQAGYMARKLNLMLYEIAENPRSVLMSKEALEGLFQSEIARMNDHMENLQFAGQRTPTGFHQIDNLTADLEVGWAYRLLEKFGTRRALFEEGGCQGWRFLEQAKVPKSLYQGIVTTYRGEREDAETSRFARELRALMQEHGLAYSILNFEKAKAEYFKARADVLLSTEDRYLIDFPDEQAEPAPIQPAPIVSVVNVEPVPDIIPQPQPQPVVENPVPVSASDVLGLTGQDLPVKQFMKQCDLLIANNRENWNEDTAKDVKTVVRIFCGILDEHNVLKSSGINQTHLAALRQHFNNILARWGSSSRYVAMTTVQLREATEREVIRAQKLNLPAPKVGLSSGTIRRHLGNLEQFLNHLVASGFMLRAFTFKGIKPKKRSLASVRALTAKPGPEEVEPIFQLPVFTGCAGPMPQEMREFGQTVYHSSLYYVPMLYAYLGARRAEFTGLMVDDVVYAKDEGMWSIKIRKNELRGLKNLQSVRDLPVPDELIRLGTDYAKRLKELGHRCLFPELVAPRRKNDTGDRFYKSFVPLLKAETGLGDQLWGRAIHALRHGFSNTLKQKGIEMSIMEDITGHLGRTEGETRYTNIASLTVMKKTIDVYPVITGHLQPQPLRLLSYVEAKEPAPWFRKEKEKPSRRRNS
jgi:integrase